MKWCFYITYIEGGFMLQNEVDVPYCLQILNCVYCLFKLPHMQFFKARLGTEE